MQKPNVLYSVVCLSDESYTAKSCYLGNMKECCSCLGWTISMQWMTIGTLWLVTRVQDLFMDFYSFVKTIHFCVINTDCLVLRSRWYALCVYMPRNYSYTHMRTQSCEDTIQWEVTYPNFSDSKPHNIMIFIDICCALNGKYSDLYTSLLIWTFRLYDYLLVGACSDKWLLILLLSLRLS